MDNFTLAAPGSGANGHKMAPMEDQALADIANRLYALPFEEFISARTAAAKEAAGGPSGKELAPEIRSLAKPSAAAWTVNMLVRARPDVLAELEELGGRMREAQEQYDAGTLRELGRERRAALAAAVDAAREVSTELGRPLSSTLATEVESTLRALTADEGAAAAVRTGRLLRSLSADGVEQVSLEGAVAVPEAIAAPAVKSPPVPQKAKEQKPEPEPKAAKAPPAKSTKPRLVAVQPKERPASSSVLETAKARAEETRREADQAAQSADERQTKAAALAEEATMLASEAKRLRAELKDVEERLDRARKLEATTAAEARQLRRAADKSLRSADLAHERVLRLGNTRT